jgi:putative FmdB family regulatory protein
MPIYAYRCESCGHAQDVLQKISDPVLTACPSCKAESFKKQLTAAGFQLKGSGWYATDFRNGSSGSSSTSGSSGSAAKPADAPAAAPAASADGGSGSSASTGGTACGGSCACH